jgi:hypothetical protein
LALSTFQIFPEVESPWQRFPHARAWRIGPQRARGEICHVLPGTGFRRAWCHCDELWSWLCCFPILPSRALPSLSQRWRGGVAHQVGNPDARDAAKHSAAFVVRSAVSALVPAAGVMTSAHYDKRGAKLAIQYTGEDVTAIKDQLQEECSKICERPSVAACRLTLRPSSKCDLTQKRARRRPGCRDGLAPAFLRGQG